MEMNKSWSGPFEEFCKRAQKIQEITPDLWIGRDAATGNFYSVSREKHGFGFFYSVDVLAADTVAGLVSPQQQPQPPQAQPQRPPQPFPQFQ